MQVLVNGQAYELHVGTTIAALCADRQLQVGQFAIAVNGTFVPRSAYETTQLKDGDQVDLLVPMQGG